MAREKTERPGAVETETPRATLSVAELRQLITLMNGSDIEEIGIEEQTGLRLTLRKPPLLAAPEAAADDEAYEVASVESAAAGPESTTVEVTSPLVGLFRVSMKRGAQPLIALGDIVREGQVICAVESLSVPNEVEAPAAGRIAAIYARDDQPVEYGQVLMAIEPQD
jgi:acetyl-CoA carboxylase biotin carboxyl carrier protein